MRDDVRSVDRVGIGDLDGDGTYDFVVKHPVGQIDPGRRVPSTDTYKIDAYNGRSGAFMWRIDLGWNINHGIWFSPMVVRDLDGDGKAEVCLRTAPYAATREQMLDPGRPFVLDGPEYLGVYDGETGKEIDKVDWIERGQVTDWADRSGNRSSRHMLGVAYLDGKTPSVLVVRGTYGLMKVDAWTLQRPQAREDLALDQRARAVHVSRPGTAQHQDRRHRRRRLRRDPERIDRDRQRRPHACGARGSGTAIASICRDIDPDRPGLEVWYTIEDPHPRNGVSLWEARTGTLIFGTPSRRIDNQVAGGLAGDIDPAHPGMEVWGDKFSTRRQGQRIDGRCRRRTSWSGGTPICCVNCTPKASSAKWKGANSGRPKARAARRRHRRRLARGDRDLRQRRAADLRHDDSRHRSPRDADAGSALSPRRHASLDGLSARADDQLLPRGGHRGAARAAGDRTRAEARSSEVRNARTARRP